MLSEEDNQFENTSNSNEDGLPKPKSSGAKLYVFILIIYLISMIMLFANC